MNELRQGLPSLPGRMAKLKIDARGYPVPYFVAWVNGEPDFRIADPAKWERCVRDEHCWVCGDPVGKFKTFVIGPMCAVNRTTSEPACHLECAVFSATACPFLTLPKAKRNDANMPEGYSDPGGTAILRNPGVTCLWTTKSFKIWNPGNGYLFRLGEPVDVQWYASKRVATRNEVLASIDSGMPLLRAECDKEEKPAEVAASHALLGKFYLRAMQYLPPEFAP